MSILGGQNNIYNQYIPLVLHYNYTLSVYMGIYTIGVTLSVYMYKKISLYERVQSMYNYRENILFLLFTLVRFTLIIEYFSIKANQGSKFLIIFTKSLEIISISQVSIRSGNILGAGIDGIYPDGIWSIISGSTNLCLLQG